MSKPTYVYVASSWRNSMQPAVVQLLRAAGIDCYDFRNPAPGVYRVELNTDGTAVQAREFQYLRLIVDRIDSDGDMAKTVLDALSVDELTKLRDLLSAITILGEAQQS